MKICSAAALLLALPTAVNAFSASSFFRLSSEATTVRNMIATKEETTTNGSTQIPQQRKRTKEERLQQASKGLQVHVLGLSIHHAQVEVREKLAIPEDDWNSASTDICASGHVTEAAVLSTCNRFEVYYSATDAREATARVTEYLSQRAGISVSLLRKNLFMLSEDDAVSHVLRVSGGLDSLVVGEGQILAQVKSCFKHAEEEDGMGGKVLSRLLKQAVHGGKRVRSETGISKGSVSISSAAAELSELNCLKDLNLPFSEARIAVVGAGKMTRLLITHLASKKLEQITIVNRSTGRPKELQEKFPLIDIDIKLMDDLWDVVGRSDIVFVATSSTDYVIDEALMKENGLAGGRPLMLVDISVPRNVGEDCNAVPNVKAYNVDDLKAVVAKNTAMRQKEMIEAEILLDQESAEFCSWRESLSAIPTINNLQERANDVRQSELDKCARKLVQNENMTDKEMVAVEDLSRRIVNKLLHGPIKHLRKSDDINQQQSAIKDMNEMFQLDEKSNSGRRRSQGGKRRK